MGSKTGSLSVTMWGAFLHSPCHSQASGCLTTTFLLTFWSPRGDTPILPAPKSLQIFGSYLEKLSFGSIRKHRGSIFIHSFVWGSADGCRLASILWFQLLVTKLSGNIHGVWTTKINSKLSKRGRVGPTAKQIDFTEIQDVIVAPWRGATATRFPSSEVDECLKWLTWDLILDQAGSHFSSLYFFFQSVHRVRKTVHSRCLNSTRHQHQTGTPRDGSSTAPYRQEVDAHKQNWCQQTEMETHPNKGNSLWNYTGTFSSGAPPLPHKVSILHVPGTEPEPPSRQELHHRATSLPRVTFPLSFFGLVALTSQVVSSTQPD